MNILPSNPLKISYKKSVIINGKPNVVLSILCNMVSSSIELALFLVFLRGCRLPAEEKKSAPIQGTIIYSESLDNKTKFDIDLDGNMDTIERTFYVKGEQFSNIAKSGDKILYQERRNYLAKPKKNMPVKSIKKIGDITYPTFLNQIETVLETITEKTTENTK